MFPAQSVNQEHWKRMPERQADSTGAENLSLEPQLWRGYRFTVHGPRNNSLPGKADIVLPARPMVIFVHGSEGHQEASASGAACTGRLFSRRARQTSMTIGRTESTIMARMTSLKFFWTKGWLPKMKPA